MLAPTRADDPRGRAAVRWAVGIVAGVLAVGPGLGPGSLLNLDLVSVPDLPVPRGVWGLGPELPRRVPLLVPIAWLGAAIGGDLAMKLLLVATVAIAVAGTARLLDDLPLGVGLGAGALYGLSPALLTRLEVGHVTLALGAALLPWALPVLLDPGRSGARTLRWSALLGLAGPQGGVLAALVAAEGLRATGWRRWRAAAAALVLGQLSWALPGLVVWAQGTALVGADAFATRLEAPLGPLALVAGDGFWQPALQLGWTEPLVEGVLALAVVGLAVLGRRALGPRAASLGVLGAVGLVGAAASGVPGLRAGWDVVTSLPPAAALREGHRLLPLALLPLHLAAAHGAVALARRWPDLRGDLVLVAPAALALTLAAPGLWGMGGALEPVEWPDDVAAARREVRSAPGTVVALPWHLYLDVTWAGGRRVLHPAPLYLGGDVLTASDLELGTPVAERADPREAGAAALVDEAARGRATAAGWADLGVRWLLLLHEADWRELEALRTDPGLRAVVDGEHVTLLEVRGWRGGALGAGGAPVGLDPVLAPLARLEAGPAVRVARAGGWGWRRGTAPARTGEGGLLEAPAGSGPLWYPPAAVALAGPFATVAACAATVRRRSAAAARAVVAR